MAKQEPKELVKREPSRAISPFETMERCHSELVSESQKYRKQEILNQVQDDKKMYRSDRNNDL